MRDLIVTSDPQAVGKFALGVMALLILAVTFRDWRRGHRVRPVGGRYGQRPPIGGFLVVCVLSMLGGLLLAADAGRLVAEYVPSLGGGG